jgi:chromosome segregation ATPase
MTEVTRIACPGCQALLRFEPEALDFPANCGACDCRFSVDIYIKIQCPQCHSGSKIRERHRRQKVRCVKCHHHFIADQGIPSTGIGRMLVAKMLDTGAPVAPETIQPFVGHAREVLQQRAIASEPDRLLEAERLKAEAIAERDKMLEETGHFRALLSKLVTTPSGAWPVDTRMSGIFPVPGEFTGKLEPPGTEAAANGHSSVFSITPASEREQFALATQIVAEEREKAEEKIRNLQAELDEARAQIERQQSQIVGEQAVAEQAKDERERAEQKLHSLRHELDRALAEVEEHRDRLAYELPLAQRASEVALEKTRSLELQINELTTTLAEAESNSAKQVFEHAEALKQVEHERTALSIMVDRLSQAVLSARAGEYEALDRLEDYANGIDAADSELVAELTAERQRTVELDQYIDELQAQVETLRLELASRSGTRELEIAELHRRYVEERQTFAAELKKARAEAEEGSKKLQEQLLRTRERLDSSTALVEQWRTSALDSEAQHKAELEQLEGTFARREQIRHTLQDENRKLTETVERLQADIRALGNGMPVARPKHSRDDDGMDSLEMLHLDNVRLGNQLGQFKAEADRRQKSLVTEIQRIKVEYEKLVVTNVRLSDRVQQLLSEKMALADSAVPSNGNRPIGQPVKAMPIAPGDHQDRELAVSIHHGGKHDDGRAGSISH